MFDRRKIESDMVLKGTTTVGVICKDGVTLATDTRVTMGFFIAHKQGKKVYKIDDHMAMTIAGGVADAQNVVNLLKANASLFKLVNNRPMPINSAARLCAHILFSNRYYPLALQAIIAGVDSIGPRIFTLDPFGSITDENKFFSTGSGSPVALGILEDYYKENITVKDAIPLVIKAVSAAMKRDAASGDSFDVSTITKDGYKELDDEIKAKNAAIASS